MAEPGNRTKKSGAAKFIFVARISKIKNPIYLLDRIAEIAGDIELSLYGPLEDRELWQACADKIATFNGSKRVTYKGELAHEAVAAAMLDHHAFVLPTLGENFGHAIFEALQSGTPVIISDKTPWKNLEKERAGFDLSLEDPASWAKALQQVVNMDESQFLEFSRGALSFAAKSSPRENVERQASVFRSAMSS